MINISKSAVSSASFSKIATNFRNDTNQQNLLNQKTSFSNAFLDQLNNKGRKGVITIIFSNSTSLTTWCVLNSKVFSFFELSNHTTLIDLFRLSQIKLVDHFSTSCFQIKKEKAQALSTHLDYFKQQAIEESHQNSKIETERFERVYCFVNSVEKDIWINLFNYIKQFL